MAEKKVIKLRNIIAVNNYKQPSEGHNRIFLWILINSSRAERKNFEIKRNGLAPRVCFVLSSFGGVPENFFFQWKKPESPNSITYCGKHTEGDEKSKKRLKSTFFFQTQKVLKRILIFTIWSFTKKCTFSHNFIPLCETTESCNRSILVINKSMWFYKT